MRLIVCNGSPRGAERSNTQILLDRFLEGFSENPGGIVERFSLVSDEEGQAARCAFLRADAVMLGFPLYVDAMPGIVKHYIEGLAEHRNAAHPQMLFLVQSGFAEATHVKPVAAYLVKLARRLGCPCAGVIGKGGAEGTRGMPAFCNRRLFDRLRRLGAGYAATGRLDETILREVVGPDRLSFLLRKTQPVIANVFFWDKQLRANGAYVKRRDRPLEFSARVADPYDDLSF